MFNLYYSLTAKWRVQKKRQIICILRISVLPPARPPLSASAKVNNIHTKEFSKHRPSGPMLSISQNVRLSVRLCVRLSVYLFTFEVPFDCLFAPTSRSWMSNIFRDSESLGKSNGKKWSNIWTFLFGNGLKSPRKKRFFLCWFCGL